MLLCKQPYRVVVVSLRLAFEVCANYNFRVVCITAGRNVDNSDSDDDDVNTAHGSSGTGRPRKKKTLLQTGRRTIVAPASEAPSALALAFSNPWPSETTSILPSAYPNWPWMQHHQV
jgi:hypothetical protein